MSSVVPLDNLLAIMEEHWRSIVIGGTVTFFFLSSYSFLQKFLRTFFSPLRDLKGPGSNNILFGHISEFMGSRPRGSWHKKLLQEYGHVCRFKFLFNHDRLLTTDTKALQHVLTNSMIWQKPDGLRFNLANLAGHGLLFAEGTDHRRQRRIMNPAFGTMHIKEMTKVFVEKSSDLADALNLLSTTSSSTESTDEWAPVEMLSYLSCTTLDIIGLAGFNYSFNALKGLVSRTTNKDSSKGHDSAEAEVHDEDPLAQAFSRTLDATTNGFSILQLLKMFFPIFRLITFDTRTRINAKSRGIVRRIGNEIVADRKQAISEEKNSGSNHSTGAKDLLTLLIKANLADSGTDRRLSDEEVMSQIPTFFIAGHETTSTSTAWALVSLACNPTIQDKLRAELLEVPTDRPTMEELNSLSYLDMVVRETLRYHAVVNETVRVVAEDDVIPFEKPFEDKYGNVRSEIRVKKGDGILIPIRVMNTLPEIWGPDSEEFKPERWINPPKEASLIPNAWGSQLSFIAGPRTCIGFRFAIVEMKALLFALVRNFEFKLNVPLDDLDEKTGIVTRPAVKSQPKAGSQLPMLIKRVK